LVDIVKKQKHRQSNNTSWNDWRYFGWL